MSTDPVHEAPLTYEEAKKLARHKDMAVRKTLAEREDIRPEILFFLAGDSSVEVRKTIAQNKSTPARAYVELAKDKSDEIRFDLAEKIAKLAPKLTAYEVDRVQSYAFQALEILASDRLANVRQILAETIKDVTQAPEELVIKLAQDSELEVSCPILEHSPILSDETLLQIIHSGISSGALGAISKRSNVSSKISDAIVDTNDKPAITSLLCNESAQIREETLDMLADRSENIPEWQGPLVRRPILSNKAVQRMTEFVADNLLEALEKREDLSPNALSRVRAEMNKRIENCEPDPQKNPTAVEQNNSQLKSEFKWLFQQSPAVIAQNLHRMGRLNSQVLINALNEGDEDFVTAGLAEMSEIDISIAQRILSMQSARGVTSLCWKAGVDADFAVRVQAKIANIEPDDIIRDTEKGYALSEDEMNWQLDFFKNMSI